MVKLPDGDPMTNQTCSRARITHVAIRFRDVVYSLPEPNRHHDVIRMIVEKNPDVTCVDGPGSVQGFLDANGVFVNRKCALISAKANGQLRPDRQVHCNMLFSENLW